MRRKQDRQVKALPWYLEEAGRVLSGLPVKPFPSPQSCLARLRSISSPGPNRTLMKGTADTPSLRFLTLPEDRDRAQFPTAKRRDLPGPENPTEFAYPIGPQAVSVSARADRPYVIGLCVAHWDRELSLRLSALSGAVLERAAASPFSAPDPGGGGSALHLLDGSQANC